MIIQHPGAESAGCEKVRNCNYKKGQDLRSMEEQKDMNTVSADTEVKEAAAGEAMQAEAPAAAPETAAK